MSLLPAKHIKHSPDTGEEVGVEVGIDKEITLGYVVQLGVAVLEVVEDTEDGAVVIVRGQRSQANVLQGDVLALERGHDIFNVELQVQHLVCRGWRRRTKKEKNLVSHLQLLFTLWNLNQSLVPNLVQDVFGQDGRERDV